MACTSILHGFFTPQGKRVIDFSYHHAVSAVLARGGQPLDAIPSAKVSYYRSYIAIPCGRCVSCRLARSREWSLRCMHEASLSDNNVFVTLTYRPADLPPGGHLRWKDLTDFWKRLRDRCGPCRYYACGEYGDQLSRPHYHAIIFGLDFDDKVLWKNSPGGRLYTSATLERVWGHGFCPIGSVTPQSAAYVARYCCKKVTGDEASFHYMGRPCEAARMSSKPGIGYDWYQRFSADCFPSGYLVQDGVKVSIPRYYDKLLARTDPDLYERVRQQRIVEVADRPLSEMSPDRLAAKTAVAEASFKKLVRSFETDLEL